VRKVGVLAVVLSLLMATHVAAASKGTEPAVSFQRFTLACGECSGVVASGGVLSLGGTLASGTYNDPFGASGIAYQSGTWTSAPFGNPFAFDELVASWNAATPDGTWIRVEMSGAGSGRTTKWYTLGIWASGDSTIHRTSVPLQGDANGFIAVDTFVRSKKAAALTSYQLRVTLYRSTGSTATPTVRFLGAMTSAASSYAIPSAHGGVVRTLDVPPLSQETHIGHFPEFDNGGEAWCSPTSTAMVLKYWGSGPTVAPFDHDDDGDIDADGEVDYAARYVFDYAYDGAGNWPYNTAYAATFPEMNGFVTRLRSLAEAERFIAAGIPLVASINGRLKGFDFGKTSGHLLVISGFDAAGNVVSDDPAALAGNSGVRRVYDRGDFEKVWLGGSAGIVYVIYRDGMGPPPPIGPNPNW
jgi:hypothetical protein